MVSVVSLPRSLLKRDKRYYFKLNGKYHLGFPNLFSQCIIFVSFFFLQVVVLVLKEPGHGYLLASSWVLPPSLPPSGFCSLDSSHRKELPWGQDLNCCSKTFSSLLLLLCTNLDDKKISGVKSVESAIQAEDKQESSVCT